MAKVLRTHQVKSEDLARKVQEEILLLTRGVPCPECVEILLESCLYRRLVALADTLNSDDLSIIGDTIMGFKCRAVHGPGVRPGSLTVVTRAEVVFK